VFSATALASVLATASKNTTPTVTLTGLNGPEALAFDPSGNLFVANFNGTTVSEFSTAALATNTTTPTAILTGLTNPIALAFDSSGDLFVANSSYGGGDKKGITLSEFAPGSSTPSATLIGPSYPVALAFDSRGNLYVALYENGTVVVNPPLVSTKLTAVNVAIPSPPPAIQAPPVIAQAVLSNTTALQAATNLGDVTVRNDTVTGENRIIQIEFVNPDGSETPILSGAPEKLEELLAKLRRNKCLNGHYRVYLTEMNLADNTVIEHRQLMEVYKSGAKLGEQDHEPGPGDRPRNDNPQTPDAAKALPQQPPVETRAEEERQHTATVRSAPAESPQAAEQSPKAVSRPDEADASKSRLSRSAVRSSMVGAAAAAIGGLGAQSVQEAWASRVDQALGGGRRKSSGRAARLSRLLRKSKS
jgi:hypothetical protein